MNPLMVMALQFSFGKEWLWILYAVLAVIGVVVSAVLGAVGLVLLLPAAVLVFIFGIFVFGLLGPVHEWL